MHRLLAAVFVFCLMVAPDPAVAQTVPEPEDYRMTGFRAPVPATLRGGTVLTTAETGALVDGDKVILVDVLPRPPKPAGLPEGTIWRPRKRYNIPGSVWLPNTGFGALNEAWEHYFRDNLARLTARGEGRRLLFYCLAECWMSWNAAKRAIAYGYRGVYWYPDGTDGWEAAGRFTDESEPVPLAGE